ncbi:MAG: DUF3237 family protein [Roseobacter sp.]|uniref:DUF3237 family protein n=1 Tax=Tateyamaria sp. TaxID=1929288 RepID=UPI003292DC97
MNVGAEWQTIFDGGFPEFDTRYEKETDDGAVIEIINYRSRHGPEKVLDAVARGEEAGPAIY